MVRTVSPSLVALLLTTIDRFDDASNNVLGRVIDDLYLANLPGVTRPCELFLRVSGAIGDEQMEVHLDRLGYPSTPEEDSWLSSKPMGMMRCRKFDRTGYSDFVLGFPEGITLPSPGDYSFRVQCMTDRDPRHLQGIGIAMYRFKARAPRTR